MLKYIGIAFILGLFILTPPRFKRSSLDSLSKFQFTSTDFLLIHYFDGNCSSCIANMIEMDNFFHKHRNEIFDICLISYSRDSILVNYYASKAKISSILLHDPIKSIYSDNKDFFLKYGNTFIIDKNKNLIISGEPLESTFILDKYLNFLNNLE